MWPLSFSGDTGRKSPLSRTGVDVRIVTGFFFCDKGRRGDDVGDERESRVGGNDNRDNKVGGRDNPGGRVGGGRLAGGGMLVG